MDCGSVAIPPLEVVHASLKFSYDGRELRVFGNAFDGNAVSSLPYLTPVLTTTGRVAKKQRGRRPTIPKRGANYWRAQCVFRGLPHIGEAVEPLQNAIRAAPEKKWLPEFAAMEKRLREEFTSKNAAARDEKSKRETGMTWQEAQREQERKILQAHDEKSAKEADAHEATWQTLDAEHLAVQDPERFLRKAFPPSDPHKAAGAIVLKTPSGHSSANIRHQATLQDLHTATTSAPCIIGTSAPRAWLVVARADGLVQAQIRAIEQAALRARTCWEEAQDAEDWDVAGAWRIECPEIERLYRQEDGEGEELWLDVYRGRVRGEMQMWARFDFRVLRGLWRFEAVGEGNGKGEVEGKGKGKGKEKGKREWEEEAESEEEEENEDFYLGPNDKVSEKQPKLNFRWRGRETGEGVIELYSDRKLCEVTFSGRGGWKLSGVLYNDLVDCTFTGVKVDSKQRQGRCDIEEQWRDHSERAYGRARFGRWK